MLLMRSLGGTLNKVVPRGIGIVHRKSLGAAASWNRSWIPQCGFSKTKLSVPSLFYVCVAFAGDLSDYFFFYYNRNIYYSTKGGIPDDVNAKNPALVLQRNFSYNVEKLFFFFFFFFFFFCFFGFFF
jgi:hypothetical protein